MTGVQVNIEIGAKHSKQKYPPNEVKASSSPMLDVRRSIPIVLLNYT